jgi:elongation factor Ts
VDISTAMVKELRERTGAGILDCKKTLQETQGDMERAIEVLREKGLARAAKKAGREAKEGLIETLTADSGRTGVMVELNCETDFVARTPDFKALAHEVAAQVAGANYAGPLSRAGVPESGGLGPEDMPGSTSIQAAIAKLGENIQVRRFVRYELDGKPGQVETYTHAGGRVAVMVELGADSAALAEKPEFKALAHDIALQIAAANPRYLRPEDVPAEVVEHEQNIYRAQLAEEKKPANIIDQIVKGKLQKYYEEVSLLNQPFIREDKVKIKDLIKQTAARAGGAIEVRRFARYELGD